MATKMSQRRATSRSLLTPSAPARAQTRPSCFLQQPTTRLTPAWRQPQPAPAGALATPCPAVHPLHPRLHSRPHPRPHHTPHLTPPASYGPFTSPGPYPPPPASPPPTANPLLDPARLVSALDKLSRVGRPPEHAWLDMYLAAVQASLPYMSLGQMATLAGALGRLRLEVPREWAAAFLQATEAALPHAQAADEAAALLTWAAEGGGGAAAPGAAWVGAAMQQIQRLSHTLTPAAAADAAWAVARLGYRPADPLLATLAAATLLVPQGGAEGQGAAGERPMGQYRPAVTPGFGGTAGGGGGGDGGGGDGPPSLRCVLAPLPPERLCRLAWAFAAYGYHPPEEWVQAFWLDGVWRPGPGPEGATALLWALGALQLPAEALWLRSYCALTLGRLGEVPPEGLVNALWALAACLEVDRAAAAAADTAAAGDASDEDLQGNDSSATGGAPSLTEAAAAAAAAQRKALEAEGEREAAAAALTAQLRRLGALAAGGGTEAQRAAAVALAAALERRRAAAAAGADVRNGGGLGAVPAQWLAEWFDVTAPYVVPGVEKTALVKALWAVAALGLAPPPGWLRSAAAAASGALAAGDLEPLELLYASRAADAMLTQRRMARRGGADTGTEGEEEGEEAEGALAAFAAESFRALSRSRLPAEWRRLNPRFPPYAQPKPGAEAVPGQAGAGAEGQGRREGVGSMGPGGPQGGGTAPARRGVLRPFR